MEKLPLVTIIVPCYNVEKYLPLCVDSIINQTYRNLEIILVDDGSPDNCGMICDEYTRKDSRIKVIHKENGGLSDARNTALDVARGEWIVFVDSDDRVSPDYVETLYHLVSKYNCKVGVAWMREFYDGELPGTGQFPYKEMMFDRMEGIERMFYQELFDTAAWCKIYHRSLFDSGIRYPYGLIYEDLPTTYLLFLQADKVAFCNRIVYNYMLRKDSLEGQPFNVRKLDSALKILGMIQGHSEELKPVKKAVRCRLLSFCFHILLEMPANNPDKRKEILMDYVKANRWKVLRDGRARRKARLGALVSYMGMNMTRRILDKIKSRSKK